jgi:hypothetical protein
MGQTNAIAKALSIVMFGIITAAILVVALMPSPSLYAG